MRQIFCQNQIRKAYNTQTSKVQNVDDAHINSHHNTRMNSGKRNKTLEICDFLPVLTKRDQLNYGGKYLKMHLFDLFDYVIQKVLVPYIFAHNNPILGDDIQKPAHRPHRST